MPANFTGSLAISGSLLLTGSITTTGGITISGSIASASFAATASSADNFVVRQNLTGSNVLATGTITAQTLVVQTVTSSIVYTSGSNIFGNLSTDVQQFTGSLRITGSGAHYIQTGCVGIGTTTPSAPLEICTNNASSGLLMNGVASTSQTFLTFNDIGCNGHCAVVTFTDNNGANKLGGLTINTYRRDTQTAAAYTANSIVANGGSMNSVASIMEFNANTYCDCFVTLTPGLSTSSKAFRFSSQNCNLMTILVGGSVGIGTCSPAADLQVHKNCDVVIAISNCVNVTSGNRGTLAFYNCAISTVALIRAVAVTDNVGTELQFHTRPAAGSLTQVMTLNQSGNVGIGTTTPCAQSTGNTTGIVDITASAGGNLVLHRNGSGDTALFSILKASNGTYIDSTGAATAANNAIIFRVNNTNADQTTVNTALRIESDRKVVVNADDNGIILRAATANQSIFYEWQTSSSVRRGYIGYGGSSSSLFEISNNENSHIDFRVNSTFGMRLSTGCTLYIGANCNQLANATPALGILAGATYDAINIKHTQNGNNTVNIWQTGTSAFGAIVFYKGNTQDERGNINVTTTGTTFNSVSDYRLKENVTLSACGLDRLMQLKPSKFNWIQTGEEAEGFIAHELQEVFPYAVTGVKDGVYSSTGNIKPQSVDYGRITPLLVKAIQEQQCQICSQATIIDQLKTCLGII